MDNFDSKIEEAKNTERVERKELKKILYSGLIFGLLIGLTLIVSGMKNLNWKIKSDNLASTVNSVKADNNSTEDIYSLFICPCCGKPLDKKNICCPMAEERINYIDSLVQTGKSEKEIILAYAKKYGLNSFVDKNKQKEFKEELAKTAPAERPIIAISPALKDIGDVSQKGGVATTFFELKNEGKKDLVIDRLETSCGCTSASIIYQEKEGPLFAMPGHGIENPTDWQITIPAGQTAQLKVYYDPNIHKDFRGPATREIYVFSNDPLDFEKSVSIDLNQVD